MEFLNKIEIKGIVGRATMQTYGDTYVSNFSVVTEYCSKDKSGLLTTETMWLSCVATTQYNEELFTIQKGDHVHVIGRLRLRRYTDADGNERTLNEVVVQSVEKIDE